jgi:hypothetical protein
MENWGVEPLRTHSVDRSGLFRPRRRFILLGCPTQGVERKCRLRAKEFNLLQTGTELWCENCGLHLTQESAIEEDRTARLQEL